jgi:hypothetical protein
MIWKPAPPTPVWNRWIIGAILAAGALALITAIALA